MEIGLSPSLDKFYHNYVHTSASDNKQRSTNTHKTEYGDFIRILSYDGDHGSTVVRVLCYKSEGRWFDRKSFRSHYGPGVNSASNKNRYQEYFLG